MPTSQLRPAQHFPPAPIAELLEAMAEGRTRTIELVSGIDNEVLESVHSPLLSPLVWDLAHIAAFEDLWISRAVGRAPLRPHLMSTYDADETPRALRGTLELLDTAGALEYMAAVRARSEEAVPQLSSTQDLDTVELVIRHEQQHNETMLQLIQLAHLTSSFVTTDRRSRPGTASPSAGGLDFVEIPGGLVSVGADATAGFAYDNERPLHQIEVKPFRLARTPATNADWLEFVEGGGYGNPGLWSERGWTWREREGVVRPMAWTQDGGHWVLDQLRQLDLDTPVTHISWYEAEAFANFHGARLPTEFEWETAATIDPATGAKRRYPWGESAASRSLANVDQRSGGPERAGGAVGATPHGLTALIGDVWEWTASSFAGYPGFVAYPYREYSEQFFGGPYRVLRGGSWATRARVISSSFRNWDLPERRQIFSGVRLARDA